MNTWKVSEDMGMLVVDSGSTKADWIYTDGQEQLHFISPGINPSTGAGLNQQFSEGLQSCISRAKSIYFYAAGAFPHSETKVYSLLAGLIRPNTSLEVQSDMMAAARACAGDRPAIIGILGTGSNSCVYDGVEIINQIPSLGYLLSDEGSGNHIGKELIRAYFYGEMAREDHQLFEEIFQVNRAIVIENLYAKDAVSAYLASFTPFLHKCSTSLKTNILFRVFGEFINTRIVKYPDFRMFDLYFAGSVAHAFEAELRACLLQEGIQIAGIITKPIEKLVLYHKSREENAYKD
ncbi:MAG: hypothetical protein IPN29_10230 [Saprospiraceae bacterium]|nr:hypothetical protein [Saprospiraceae bacterium]